MLVISMRTRRFHGIKTRSIVIRAGYALVLVLALAAFSLPASTVLTALIVSDAQTVSAAEAAVAGAAEAVVEAAAEDTSLIDIRKRESPSVCRGFSSEGQTYETNPNT